jgi:hypothetical protein
MCGRFASGRDPDDLAVLFGSIRSGEAVSPSWNIAPTDPVQIVLERADRIAPRAVPVRQLRPARWGLVSFWSTDSRGAARRINARLETAAERPAFRRAFRARRCLLPADGYYEWQRTPAGGKTPHFLRPAAAACWPSPGSTSCGAIRPARRRTRPRGCGQRRSSPRPPSHGWRTCTTGCPSPSRRRGTPPGRPARRRPPGLAVRRAGAVRRLAGQLAGDRRGSQCPGPFHPAIAGWPGHPRPVGAGPHLGGQRPHPTGGRLHQPRAAASGLCPRRQDACRRPHARPRGCRGPRGGRPGRRGVPGGRCHNWIYSGSGNPDLE